MGLRLTFHAMLNKKKWSPGYYELLKFKIVKPILNMGLADPFISFFGSPINSKGFRRP